MRIIDVLLTMFLFVLITSRKNSHSYVGETPYFIVKIMINSDSGYMHLIAKCSAPFTVFSTLQS